MVFVLAMTLVAGPALASGATTSVKTDTDTASNETTYAVVQGQSCVDVAPFGDGSQMVEQFYDYRGTDDINGSVGTRDLQSSQTSQLLLHEGSNGVSLIALHDELGDESGGGLVSFNVTGQPAGAEWVVQDDAATTDDTYVESGGDLHVDWFWTANHTDGGALRGLESDEFDALGIQASFNGDIHRDHPDADYDGGEIQSWNVLSDDGTADGAATALNMSENVSVVDATCEELVRERLLNRVDVWERSVLPLQADTSNAATAVPNAEWIVDGPDGNQVPMNKPTLAVFDQSDTVTVEYDLDTAFKDPKEYKDRPVHLVAARLNESDGSAFSLLDMNVSAANDRVTFTSVERTRTNADGDVTVDFDPPQSGQYALMLATNESDADGLVVTDGDLSIDGNVTVIGLEEVAVQRSASTVVPATLEEQSAVEPGENLTFDATAGGADGTVGHTVVVYDERTGWVNQSFTIDLTESPSSSGFNVSEDVLVEHSINRTNGVLRVDGERRSRPVDVPEFLDAVTPDSVEPNTEYVAAEGGDRLDASLTAVNGSASETVTVETLANWTTNTRYRWVHVAVESDGSATYTDTGTFRLGTTDDGDGSDGNGTDGNETDDPDEGGGSGGGGGGGAPPGGVGPPIKPTEVNVTAADGRAIARIRNAKAFQAVDLDISSVFADRESVRLERLSITFSEDREFDATISQGPESVPAVHDGESDFEHFNVSYDEEPATDEVRFTFSVDRELIEENDLSTGSIALYRYADGEWEQLDTTVVGGTGDSYRYRAESPGLSVFAVSTTEPRTGPSGAAFNVTNPAIDKTTVAAGENATVGATVVNAGDAEGTFTLELTVDGDVVDRRSVTLVPGEDERVTFTRTFEDPGSYRIGIGGLDAGELVVEDRTTAAPASPVGDDDGPGLLLWVGLLVLFAVAALLLYAWRSDDIDFPPDRLGDGSNGPDDAGTDDVLDDRSQGGSSVGDASAATGDAPSGWTDSGTESAAGSESGADDPVAVPADETASEGPDAATSVPDDGLNDATGFGTTGDPPETRNEPTAGEIFDRDGDAAGDGSASDDGADRTDETRDEADANGDGELSASDILDESDDGES
jgi:hypothetical protein